MTFGVVMLVHNAFDRVERLVRHWNAGGCPVVLHVDKNVSQAKFDALRGALRDLPGVRFSKRYRCEWGTWGIVAAAQSASELMLSEFPDISHVYLASGSCLPLRPIRELRDYLARRANTDFIESATTADVPWIVDGLSEERFTLRFPFAWKKNRRLFDLYVELQRRLGGKRKIPAGLMPHLGSQWWCLSRDTLNTILKDPRRAEYDAYFRRTWIPDESYFQTLVRHISRHIESRSLTLAKFDFQGRPHIFYDDHLELLRRSECFVARKVWPKANRLWDSFLNDPSHGRPGADPNPERIDRIFAKAVLRRVQGRPGLYMHSRFPVEGREQGVTAAPYTVFEGFTQLFPDFETWLSRKTGLRVHGHLFAPEKAEFEGRPKIYAGGLSNNPVLRDYNAKGFFFNLLWNTRSEHQCFQFGPRDCQDISWVIAKDPNAQINVISGAWAIDLFRSNRDFGELRGIAAKLQKIEADHLGALRSPYAKAKIRIWTLSEFVETPAEFLRALTQDIALDAGRTPMPAPQMADLTGFGQFLQNLKNQGMHPYLMGNFPTESGAKPPAARPARRPYLMD